MERGGLSAKILMLMPALGQKAKHSRRADVFRFTPGSGRRPVRSAGPVRAKSRHPSRDGTFTDVVTSSIDPCRSWVYNLPPGTPPWQLGQGRPERLPHLLYGEYAEEVSRHATTHQVCP